MDTKHTPGPWRVINCDVFPAEDDDGFRCIHIAAGKPLHSAYAKAVTGYIDCGGKRVGSVNSRTDPEAEANARLIAAAPELLEALRVLEAALIRDMGAGYSGVALCQAAIAKATGQ